MSHSWFWVAKAIFSHYWQHRWQTLFLIIGLTAGVGLWSAVQIINQQARLSYERADSLLGVQASHWIRAESDRGVSQKDYIQFRRLGFRQVFPIVEGEVSTSAGQPISIIATDLFALPENVFESNQDNSETDTGSGWLDFIQPPYRAWVPQELANELNLQPDEQLELRDGRQLPPTIIQSHEQQGRQVFMDIAAAFELLSRDHFSYLAVGELAPEKLSALQQALPPHLILVENQQHLDLAQLTESLHTHLSAMSLLSFAVGLFIVFNAVRFSLWYRRPTFINLRLMGVSGRSLSLAIALEVLLWSFLGTGLGLIIGIQISQILLPGLGASLHSLYNATIETDLIWQTESLLKAWLITLAGLCWALGWPLYQQLRRNSLPSQLLERAPQDEQTSRYQLLIAGIGFIVVSGLIYPNLNNAVSGFVLLGLLLFAAAWTLPSLLAFSLTLLTKSTARNGLIARWLISDGWSQLPALRTAMMALLLAMTANLGVGTLVDSFRNAFVNWLEVRQSADLYLRAPNIDRHRLLNPTQSEQWLAHSHERIGVNTRWQGRQSLIRGVDTDAPDSRTLPLAQWAGDSPEMALQKWREEAKSILANEQAHYLGGLNIGDQLELVSDNGTQNYHVVGFFYDYGTPYYQFYLPYDEVATNWRANRSRGIALWLKTSDNPAQTLQLAEIAMRAAGAKTGDWISQAQLRKLSLTIFERTFAITSAMNGLTLIVAAIALLASLLAILQERLPQFAQWRALGIRWREQMLIITTPILIFVSIAWLLAVPLGALLSWILIHKLNIVSFGWSMPMTWAMAPAWQLAGVIMLAVISTLILAGWQLKRKLPGQLAKLGEMA